MRTGIDFQSFFHCGDKVRIGFGRDHPVCFCGLTSFLLTPVKLWCHWSSQQSPVAFPTSALRPCRLRTGLLSLASPLHQKSEVTDQEPSCVRHGSPQTGLRKTVERLVSNASATRSSDHPDPFSDTSALSNIRFAEFIAPLPSGSSLPTGVRSSGVNRIPNAANFCHHSCRCCIASAGSFMQKNDICQYL